MTTTSQDRMLSLLAAAEQAAASAANDDEATALAARLLEEARRIKAARWEPYPWQHPHTHPPGWESTRAPGVCDPDCLTIPPVEVTSQGMWLALGGRGTGKTEGMAHYINAHAEGPPCDPRLPGGHRIVIVAPTQGDAVEACVTGPSGLQTINPSVALTTTREGTVVRWPNRARARLLGAHGPTDVDRLRAAGNSCVLAGTLIATERGPIPIEEVRPGDRVWTRTGLRRVLRAEATGVRPVMRLTHPAGHTWLTPDHPVALADGRFAEAAAIDGNVLVWPNELSTTAAPSTSAPPATGPTAPEVSSTATSTPPKSAPSHAGGTYTTSTTTSPTTTQPTSWHSTPPTTAPPTPATGSGTRPEAGRPPPPAPPSTASARYAEPSSPAAPPSQPASALLGAATPGHPHAHQSNACARCVAEGSPASAGPAPVPVPTPAALGQPTPLGLVYDLAVEGHHEFYANGLLVGNCVVWLEELAAMRRLAEVLHHTALGLRIGGRPHFVGSTTPKPREELTDLLAERRTITTKGRTQDAHRLDPATRAVWEEKFGGTTLGRQELDGEILGDVEGALWVHHRPDIVDGQPNQDHRPGIENDRVDAADYGWTSHDPTAPAPTAPHLMQRVIITVDPPGGRTECGIVAVGTIGQTAYVLADLSLAGPPDTWAKVVLDAYTDFGAEGIAAEHTYGGDMVADVIGTRAQARGIHPPIFKVPTKVGKRLRAEPVQAVAQQHRVKYVGVHPGLESELTAWVPGEGESPNRLDAFVHGVTYLLIRAGAGAVSAPTGQRIARPVRRAR